MVETNIPKVIHYCWFGNNPLPESAIKCINSWKQYFPDYEIKEWNESNFDLNSCEYIKDAYKERKWAHVSDFARIYVLYHHGGVYFDTDVEVIKPFDNIIRQGAFLGCEKEEGRVNPGLGMAAEKHNVILKAILDDYYSSSFYTSSGTLDIYNTIVTRTTNALMKYGYADNGEFQMIEGISVYPKEYFNPMNYNTGKLYVTDNTYSIHWYDGSWLPKGDNKIHLMEQKIRQKFGGTLGNVLSFVYRKGYRLLEAIGVISKE